MSYIKELEEWNNSPDNSYFLSPEQSAGIKTILTRADAEIEYKNQVEESLLEIIENKENTINKYIKREHIAVFLFSAGMTALGISLVFFWMGF